MAVVSLGSAVVVTVNVVVAAAVLRVGHQCEELHSFRWAKKEVVLRAVVSADSACRCSHWTGDDCQLSEEDQMPVAGCQSHWVRIWEALAVESEHLCWHRQTVLGHWMLL